MFSGMDFGSSLLAGVSQEAILQFNQAIMKRINPPPRPLLDFTGDLRAGQFTTYDPTPVPNIQYLQPSIVLQPHQPNVEATQQPLNQSCHSYHQYHEQYHSDHQNQGTNPDRDHGRKHRPSHRDLSFKKADLQVQAEVHRRSNHHNHSKKSHQGPA